MLRLSRRTANRPARRLTAPPPRVWRHSGLMFFAWWLIWLSAAGLRFADYPRLPDDPEIGQPAPVTLRAAISFATSGRHDAALTPRISAGTILLEQGRTITPETAARLRDYENAWRSRAGQAQWLTRRTGDGLLLLIGVAAFAWLLNRMAPATGRAQLRSIFLLWILSLLALLGSHWITLLQRYHAGLAHAPGAPAALLPGAALMAAILLGPWPAIIVGGWTALSAAIFAEYNLQVFFTGLIQAIVASYAYRVRTRRAILRIGLLIGLAGALCTVVFSLADFSARGACAAGCVWSIGGGIAAALLALLCLPLLEVLFGIATDISLLELADMEHPILRRLAIEAPGTYQHSLMVANLAQAAAAAIGGNGLRARIMAYFHDIGKLAKPDFFAENIQFRDNPHDELNPRMSCLVIISHVKEGISLALQHKLPQPIIDGIARHHGTGVVSFFYHKAAANAAENQTPAPDEFRYPGPKPATREVAVLSLADAVEAASRSLAKVTPASIEGLVRDIVNERLRDGQLDEAPLTIAEIKQLQRTFIFTLTNMLHSRLSYPPDEDRHQSESNTAPRESGASAATDVVPPATDRAN